MSEDLLNHFIGKLMEGLDEIERLWLDLEDESFFLNIHGYRYVNYSIQAQFEVVEVDYSPQHQTVVFRQLGPTELRGRVPFGRHLSKLVDEPLKEYLCGFDFVSYRNNKYTFDLRRSETMRSFFDLELTGVPLTILFPFSDLKVNSDEVRLVG
jgi:hypothetical protein